jgi:hypothetical protein
VRGWPIKVDISVSHRSGRAHKLSKVRVGCKEEGQDQGVKQTFSSVEDRTAPCLRRETDENLAQRDFADTQLFGIESWGRSSGRT